MKHIITALAHISSEVHRSTYWIYLWMLESLRSSPSLKQTILTLNMYTTSRFILKVICNRIHIITATQSMAIIYIPARRIRPAPTSYTGTVHLSSPESRWAPNPETEGLRSSIATQSHQQALHGKAVPLSINTATEEVCSGSPIEEHPESR